MRIQNLLAVLVACLCLQCCYPMSAFHGHKGYCLWNLSKQELTIKIVETNELHQVAPKDYLVMERKNNFRDTILVSSYGINSNKVNLATKQGSLSKNNGVIWIHLIICEKGHVHKIGPATKDFANAVIHQSSPRKNW